MNPADAAQLQDLAGRVRRLILQHTDPEAFYEERSEIAAELDSLAQRGGLASGYDRRGRPVHAISARETAALNDLKQSALRIGLSRPRMVLP